MTNSTIGPDDPFAIDIGRFCGQREDIADIISLKDFVNRESWAMPPCSVLVFESLPTRTQLRELIRR